MNQNRKKKELSVVPYDITENRNSTNDIIKNHNATVVHGYLFEMFQKTIKKEETS